MMVSFHFCKWIFQVMDSYFSLLNLSFVENRHISIFTTFAKQSMINRLLNAINRNRSAAKISKVMSSSNHPLYLQNFIRWPASFGVRSNSCGTSDSLSNLILIRICGVNFDLKVREWHVERRRLHHQLPLRRHHWTQDQGLLWCKSLTYSHSGASFNPYNLFSLILFQVKLEKQLGVKTETLPRQRSKHLKAWGNVSVRASHTFDSEGKTTLSGPNVH